MIDEIKQQRKDIETLRDEVQTETVLRRKEPEMRSRVRWEFVVVLCVALIVAAVAAVDRAHGQDELVEMRVGQQATINALSMAGDTYTDDEVRVTYQIPDVFAPSGEVEAGGSLIIQAVSPTAEPVGIEVLEYEVVSPEGIPLEVEEVVNQDLVNVLRDAVELHIRITVDGADATVEVD